MKKALFILTMMASSFISMAQKGSWYVGGVAGFASNTAKSASGFKTSNSSWAFGPEGGTFLKDDIQLGLALGISGTSSKNDNTKISTSTNISPTVYMRKFFKVTDNFSTFAGLYLNYTSGKSTDYTSTPSIESTQSGVGLRLGLGIAYALSPRFTAVGQYGLMGFQSTTNKVSGTKTGTDSNFNFGVNTVGSSTLSQGNGSGAVFNIGLYYTFKKSQ
jgi:outer membrane protein W